ncbi:enoyl-CoA hydratase-related protein [Magnetospirillum sp. 15-1]|uniref:enoyl-CoA hydratase-related protein n=1 Tax=Magnetospirillum sp. 15-1 TaxID=1979370 RepID=UPI000BBCD433|nr:enoyl-CoA hydratase-related protein [Magnetospirillum sp. 15-1]
MAYRNLSLVIEGGIACLTIDRDAVLNALDADTVDELRDACAAVEKDETARVLVLTGAGRAFSSGADLGGGTGELSMDILRKHANPLIEQLYALRVPIVVAVNGAAVGAGCSLALAGDIVVAARSAYFLLAFAKVGLVPDTGATWLLPRLLGRSRATAAMMLGERITAETAAAWGMVHSVVDDNMLADTVAAISAKLAEGPTLAYGLIRHGIRECLEAPLSRALEIETRHQEIASASRDFAEGVIAFREKRKPVFIGR